MFTAGGSCSAVLDLLLPPAIAMATPPSSVADLRCIASFLLKLFGYNSECSKRIMVGEKLALFVDEVQECLAGAAARFDAIVVAARCRPDFRLPEWVARRAPPERPQAETAWQSTTAFERQAALFSIVWWLKRHLREYHTPHMEDWGGANPLG